MKLRITISKYHSGYLCQISLQNLLLPIQNLIAIGQGKKTLLRGLKNIGMASEKLYRNTLSQDILATAVMNFYAANFVKIQFLI